VSRSVLVFINRSKQDAVEVLPEVLDLISSNGQVAGVLDTDDEDVTLPEADMVLVLGGDGSLLTAAHRTQHLNRPILGVNVGRVGFMSGFELDRLRACASDVFGTGKLSTRRLPAFTAEIRSAGSTEVRFSSIAFNEFVVTAGPPFRMIALELTIDGEPGPAVSGDGMIVATPMGSTAYNVSAGGPIVAPGAAAYVITPIAAHSLSFRPIVVPDSCVVELRIDEVNSENGGGTTLVADGRVSHRIESGDRIRYAATEQSIELVVDPSVSYWRTLLGKMHWAAAPKQRDR
jgi:NAD+ kinase